MFDKIKRKATATVKRAIGNAVEDQVEKETKKQVSKVEADAQAKYTEAMKDVKVKEITGSIITSFEAFSKSWEKTANKPEQSVFHFLIGAYNYCKNPKVGEAMVTLILSKKHNTEDSSSPSGLKLGPTNKSLMENMRSNINIVKSYLGGKYTDDYKFDENKLTMSLLSVGDDGKEAKVVIQSGGKDFPTPVSLAKNKDGQWKITEFSSIATGCRKTKSKEDDF